MASGADILLIEQLIKGYQVGAKNPADVLTKPKAVEEISELLKPVGVKIVRCQR